MIFLHFIRGEIVAQSQTGARGPCLAASGSWGQGKGAGDLQQLELGPFRQVVTSAKDVVASGVTGMVGLARQGRRWSVELKRSMSHAVDVVLGKSEELVDHFLPMTEEELGKARALPARL